MHGTFSKHGKKKNRHGGLPSGVKTVTDSWGAFSSCSHFKLSQGGELGLNTTTYLSLSSLLRPSFSSCLSLPVCVPFTPLSWRLPFLPPIPAPTPHPTHPLSLFHSMFTSMPRGWLMDTVVAVPFIALARVLLPKHLPWQATFSFYLSPRFGVSSYLPSPISPSSRLSVFSSLLPSLTFYLPPYMDNHEEKRQADITFCTFCTHFS